MIKNLSGDDFTYLSQEFEGFVEFLKQKGFYFYEYMDSFENLEYLSRKEKFHNSLTDKHINNKVCQPVVKVWKASQVKIIKEYRNL